VDSRPMRKLLEVIGLSFLVVLWVITWGALHGPNPLPATIPTHFDTAGNPNGWGSPSGIIFMPLIATALYLLITVVSFFPASFNYPVRVTPQNRSRLEAISLSMIGCIKLELAVLFTVLQQAFVQAARTGQGTLFPRILPISLVVIFGTIGLHALALFKAARSNGA
jgi:uncharacterized membrane protein